MQNISVIITCIQVDVLTEFNNQMKKGLLEGLPKSILSPEFFVKQQEYHLLILWRPIFQLKVETDTYLNHLIQETL
jgi:hypothetical protein